MVGETGVLIGVVLYLGAAAREARFLGRKMFFENLVSSIQELDSCKIFIDKAIMLIHCILKGHCPIESPFSDLLHARNCHGLLALVLFAS